jgi:hypothetical protein
MIENCSSLVDIESSERGIHFALRSWRVHEILKARTRLRSVDETL